MDPFPFPLHIVLKHFIYLLSHFALRLKADPTVQNNVIRLNKALNKHCNRTLVTKVRKANAKIY